MSSATPDPRIRVLPPQVANQIAAGEVVERPSSVVKELLENSLDAGACTIDLDVEKGGVQRILLRDDGHGIRRDDLRLAFSPHATSKIASAEDLEGVGSLGFRGEALASIASVSRTLLKSRRGDEAQGWQLRGGEQEVAPAALLPGTEVEVCDLFYNTPARRKFLRSERTELSHVEEVVRRIALSRFDLAIRFAHNGKPMLRLKTALTPAEQERRVAEVLGKSFLDNAIAMNVAAEGLRLWGWVGNSGYSRSHADSQYVYLNGRMIRDRLVGHAVRLAFGDDIPEGRFASYLLYLELDPHQVDVNVHPTKHEVRFREARQVHDFIYWAINKALMGGGERSVVEEQLSGTGVLDVLVGAQRLYAHGAARGDHYITPLRAAVAEQRNGYLSAAAAENRGAEPFLGYAMAQLKSGYLLSERSDATLLIDLRMLLRELYRHRLASAQRSELLTAQPLLIPYSTTLSSAAAQLWRARADVLQQWGFEWGWLGEEVVVLRKVPALLRNAATARVVDALGEWLATLSQGGEIEHSLTYLLATRALPEALPAYGNGVLNNMLREYEQGVGDGQPQPWREIHAADWPRLFDLLS